MLGSNGTTAFFSLAPVAHLSAFFFLFSSFLSNSLPCYFFFFVSPRLFVSTLIGARELIAYARSSDGFKDSANIGLLGHRPANAAQPQLDNAAVAQSVQAKLRNGDKPSPPPALALALPAEKLPPFHRHELMCDPIVLAPHHHPQFRAVKGVSDKVKCLPGSLAAPSAAETEQFRQYMAQLVALAREKKKASQSGGAVDLEIFATVPGSSHINDPFAKAVEGYFSGCHDPHFVPLLRRTRTLNRRSGSSGSTIVTYQQLLDSLSADIPALAHTVRGLLSSTTKHRDREIFLRVNIIDDSIVSGATAVAAQACIAARLPDLRQALKMAVVVKTEIRLLCLFSLPIAWFAKKVWWDQLGYLYLWLCPVLILFFLFVVSFLCFSPCFPFPCQYEQQLATTYTGGALAETPTEEASSSPTTHDGGGATECNGSSAAPALPPSTGSSASHLTASAADAAAALSGAVPVHSSAAAPSASTAPNATATATAMAFALGRAVSTEDWKLQELYARQRCVAEVEEVKTKRG